MAEKPVVNLNTSINSYGIDDWATSLFLKVVNDTKSATFYTSKGWQTDASLPDFPAILKSGVKRANVRVGVHMDTIYWLTLGSDGDVMVYAVAKDEPTATAFIEYLHEALPDREPVGGIVPVRFWSLGQHGPDSVVRRIQAPDFDDILLNYPRPVSRTIDEMIGPDFEPGKGGQLLLWHGPPGTGKTWALRSLCRAWQSWCSIEYIVDPEAFFGKAAYLMGVLVGKETAADKWRLMVLEDTGELLGADAKTRTGQGLSRLLNSVDGFIGQGLKILVMMTTNEEIGRLHEAVSRPGRAAVRLGFTELNRNEALAWAEANDLDRALVPSDNHQTVSLAELYALRDGNLTGETNKRRVGFVPAA